MRWRSPLLLGLVALLGAAPGAARTMRLDRVVLLMRHGVRPPTKDPPMPPGTAAETWPRWPVAPGFLTPHGAAAIGLLGASDRRWLVTAGLLPARGCPAAGAVAALSDSDQRTIATGDAYLAALAPGCAIENEHRPQGAPDPLFAGAGAGGAPFDPARADAAVADALGPGGIAGVEAAERPLLARVDRILCGAATAGCGLGAQPSAILPAEAGRRPRLSGRLDRASTAAQILLLQYAEGKPLAEVGWGRASIADVTALSELHALEFRLLARPAYLARANIRPIARQMLHALTAPVAARVTLIVGHDTNVASLGGLLGLHWQVPGYAADDPPPGGAIALELWVDGSGRRLVRASFRAQALQALRRLDPAVSRVPLRLAACPGDCPLDRFAGTIEAALAP